MKATANYSMPMLLTFGAASAAGLFAALLMAPESGQQTRTRLAARLRYWAESVAGRGHGQHRSTAPGGRHSSPMPGANLAMQPDHLLANQ